MNLRRLLCACGLILLSAGVASAQEEAPKVEVFAGYSYVRANPGFGLSGVNLNGGSASFSYNPTGWLGLVGDVGGYHGDELEVGADAYTYLFGPKLAFRRSPFTPYAQLLFGGAHGDVPVACMIGGGGGARIRRQSTTFCLGSSENAFAMAIGGGLDWNATEHFGLRLIQAEYLMTHFVSDTQNNARISTGVVFRW